MRNGEYVIFCVEFRCNSNCPICSIDDLINQAKPISFSVYKEVLKHCVGKYSGIILSGGEVTLNKQLPEFIMYAKQLGFQNVMIQTNGRVLSDLSKAEALKSAGADQFFFSFHSSQKDLSDIMSARGGAYAQTVKALENLEKLGLEVITNTVISSVNYKGLLDTARFLNQFSNIHEMHFWGFVPLSRKSDELVLPYVLAAPYLNETLKYVESCKKRVWIKYFPACLLDISYRQWLDNSQSKVLGIADDFWRKWDACDFHRYSCCEGTDCMGLPQQHKNVGVPKDFIPARILNHQERRVD